MTEEETTLAKLTGELSKAIEYLDSLREHRQRLDMVGRLYFKAYDADRSEYSIASVRSEDQNIDVLRGVFKVAYDQSIKKMEDRIRELRQKIGSGI